jgi:hypothetical protein
MDALWKDLGVPYHKAAQYGQGVECEENFLMHLKVTSLLKTPGDPKVIKQEEITVLSDESPLTYCKRVGLPGNAHSTFYTVCLSLQTSRYQIASLHHLTFFSSHEMFGGHA